MKYHVKRPYILVFAAFASTATAETNFDISGGYRHDSLKWNIANDIDGATTPNVLSELSWNSLRSTQLAANWNTTTLTGLHLRAALAYAWIFSGENQDSDYVGNNRTGEFSRSNNDSNGDSVWDGSAAIGYRILSATPAGEWQVTPMIGLSSHEQKVRMTNGNQTIPATGPFSGLNSTYQSQWQGPWAGVEIETTDAANRRSFLRLEYHRADYYGEANWNLRSDFDHPKSFEHDADGDGFVVSFGVSTPADIGQWSTNFAFNYQSWRTGAGIDRTFFSDGTTALTKLNEVEWKSWALSIGLARRF